MGLHFENNIANFENKNINKNTLFTIPFLKQSFHSVS